MSDTEFKAKVGIKIGPVQATFNGQVELSDLDPPNGYTISGSGSGGAAGNAKGGAKVRLVPEGGATRLTYDVDAQVTGKLAQLGSRLIDSTAKMLAGQFFNKFENLVSEPVQETVAAGEGQEAAGGATTPAQISSSRSASTPTWAWLVGAALLAIIATYLLMGR